MVCKIFAPHNTRVLYDYSDPRRGYLRTGYNNVNAGNTTTILAHLRICFLLAKLWYSYIIFCKDETPQSNIRQCKKTWWRGNPFTRRKRCCGSAETGIWKCRCRKQIGFFSKCSARELRLSNCAIPEPSIITRCQRIHQNPGKVTTSNFQSWRRWARRILRFDALAKRVSHLSPLAGIWIEKKHKLILLVTKITFLPYIDQDCQRQLESWKIPCLSPKNGSLVLTAGRMDP